MIETYWATKVWSTGGTESTKNKNEQTNFEESRWVMEGVNKGLKELYPDRYDDSGNLSPSCLVGIETKYGDEACADAYASYAAGVSGSTPCKGDDCNTIQCYAGNDTTATAYTSSDNCDLVALKYGYSQW